MTWHPCTIPSFHLCHLSLGSTRGTTKTLHVCHEHGKTSYIILDHPNDFILQLSHDLYLKKQHATSTNTTLPIEAPLPSKVALPVWTLPVPRICHPPGGKKILVAMVNLVAVWTINGITFSKINDENNVVKVIRQASNRMAIPTLIALQCCSTTSCNWIWMRSNTLVTQFHAWPIQKKHDAHFLLV